MKSKSAPLLLLVLFLVLLSSCSDVKEPEFKALEKFQLNNVNLQEATIGFQVRYFNPNNFGLSVKETVADVYLDSVYLGQFLQEGPVQVEKNADFAIPLRGRVGLQKVVGLDLKSLASRTVLVRATGSTRVGRAGIFVKREISYEGRHRLEELRLP
jgi:LEA14-like dessication related protein